MKAQLREFRPKDLPRIIATLPANGHPDLADIEAMAQDTLSGVDGAFKPSPSQVEGARQTIDLILNKGKETIHVTDRKRSHPDRTQQK